MSDILYLFHANVTFDGPLKRSIHHAQKLEQTFRSLAQESGVKDGEKNSRAHGFQVCFTRLERCWRNWWNNRMGRNDFHLQVMPFGLFLDYLGWKCDVEILTQIVLDLR